MKIALKAKFCASWLHTADIRFVKAGHTPNYNWAKFEHIPSLAIKLSKGSFLRCQKKKKKCFPTLIEPRTYFPSQSQGTQTNKNVS